VAEQSGRTNRSGLTTTDHEEIRRWVDQRGGRPACVRGTGGKGDPGLLRIDFPGFSGEETLLEISWDEWLQAFDRNGLAFVYQDDPESRFNKLVSRETTTTRPREGGGARRGARGRSRTAGGAGARAGRRSRRRR
jgi:hypothetical protein